jgi:hypothetical protein
MFKCILKIHINFKNIFLMFLNDFNILKKLKNIFLKNSIKILNTK